MSTIIDHVNTGFCLLSSNRYSRKNENIPTEVEIIKKITLIFFNRYFHKITIENPIRYQNIIIGNASGINQYGGPVKKLKNASIIAVIVAYHERRDRALFLKTKLPVIKNMILAMAVIGYLLQLISPCDRSI